LKTADASRKAFAQKASDDLWAFPTARKRGVLPPASHKGRTDRVKKALETQKTKPEKGRKRKQGNFAFPPPRGEEKSGKRG
jgi:hypothetical protein